MSSLEFIGRQPIIDHAGELIAYDLFYDISIHEDSSNIAPLIASVINTFCIHNVLGDVQGFIKIDDTFLMSGIIYSVPKQLFILSLPDSITLNHESYERLVELHGLGYCFALHDISYIQAKTLKKLSPLFPLLSYLKVDIKNLSQEYMAKLTKLLNPYSLKMIATDVNTQEEYAIAKSIGFPYVEGYYFSEPISVEHQSVDSKLLTVIRLYNMLTSSATTTEELTMTFESNPELTIQLLQYINSSAFSLRIKISSIAQVLILLGRKSLSQWLLLLMYGKHINHSPTQSLLMQMVSRRTALMKGFYKLLNPRTTSDAMGEAFFVGVMSLASAVMSMPLRLILKDMHLSEEVMIALLEHKGVLGELLETVEAIERFNIEKIQAFIHTHNLSSAAVLQLISTTALSSQELD
ncbi:MAG: HDOD domain-containing protein [Sulfuricurvum sp.]|uniref:EAL and HDOD domain-containing protein n=1 Tax=Sulfuricurvum sp. TaxID=2025608 RepID=UPI002736FAB6|nr:HDOD domain-containing protein [Sulfuricurvum sp.]MDP3291386.1 HDOD domain-containing protein [Sulfuricurvum sp.]